MNTTVPHLGELIALPAWRTVEFISDLHLEPNTIQTNAAFLSYLQQTTADAVVILGDLFEVWVGDDCLDDPNSFEFQCASALNEATTKRAIYFMRGNRDFLIGSDFAKLTRVTLLDDPTVLRFAGENWLLSHGDAMCLADVDYMAFRALVRTPEWHREFLAKPLTERKSIARAIRSQSESRKQTTSMITDIDSDMACKWLDAANADTLVHGHTHQPAEHSLPSGARSRHRVVLSDWDSAAIPSRLQVLSLGKGGLSRFNL
jgi:UDP-2,3-diacylglucosamine hydrolase